MDEGFPSLLTRFHNVETDQRWFLCRACLTTSEKFFSETNLRMQAREHARRCRKDRNAHAQGT